MQGLFKGVSERLIVHTNVHTGCGVKFEWDENKNIANISKHSIDFNDVPELFMYPMLTLLDGRVYA